MNHCSASPPQAAPASFKVSYPESVICLPRMDHCHLRIHVPNIEQRRCLGFSTGALKPRVTFHFEFLHVASLFFQLIFWENEDCKPLPISPLGRTLQLCLETSIFLPLQDEASFYLQKLLFQWCHLLEKNLDACNQFLCLVVLRWNPGPHACQSSTWPLSYISSLSTSQRWLFIRSHGRKLLGN